MKGFILAAGLGTRLKPITDFIPKPLVPIFDVTPLDICIQRIIQTGASDISINTHHLSEKISKHLSKKNYANINISFERDKILGVGGGIGKLKKYFAGDNVLVYNADIVSNMPLDELIDFHKTNGNWATLGLVKNKPTDIVLFDESNSITSFEDKKKNGFTFSGISIISEEIYSQLPEDEFYNIIDLYKKIIKSPDSFRIKGLLFDNVFWSDIGNPKSYMDLWTNINQNEGFFEYFGISQNSKEYKIFNECKSIFINSQYNCNINNSLVFMNKIIQQLSNSS